MQALIGYTGFVGSNLLQQGEFPFCYNSHNIGSIKGKTFDLVVCAGVSAVKWLANQNPEQYREGIRKLTDNLSDIKTKMFVLISTIDIYDAPVKVDETTIPNKDNQDAYGGQQYHFENWIKENFNHYLIVRLPALFGPGLKKNFIYDILNPIPRMYSEKLWQQLMAVTSQTEKKRLNASFTRDNNGVYAISPNLSGDERKLLKELLGKHGYTSLIFTDCRSRFPFYNLAHLWQDIQFSITKDYGIINLAVEPISCAEIAKNCLNFEFTHQIENKAPMNYDMKSIYYKDFNGKNGYLYHRDRTLAELKTFFNNHGVRTL